MRYKQCAQNNICTLKGVFMKIIAILHPKGYNYAIGRLCQRVEKEYEANTAGIGRKGGCWAEVCKRTGARKRDIKT